MPEAAQNINRNRYPGVQPFSSSEDFMFFGRDADIEELSSLIFIKQTVILYGKSGYGKSSLINAGIIPKIKNEVGAHFVIRFNNYSEKEAQQTLSPTNTVKRRLAEQIILTDKNLIDKLIPSDDSFWYWIKQYQLHSHKPNFILFFDQFEELFTYPKQQIEEFSGQLSELLYTGVPARFKKAIANSDALSDDAYQGFFFEKPEVRVVISIRSDRMSLLNNLTDRHPGILQHCYELNALSATDASKVIEEPAKLPQSSQFKTSEFNYADQAINLILDKTTDPLDGKIEAATLQIICRYIEDVLVAEKKNTVIDAANLGNVDDIFEQYYQSILAKLDESDRLLAQRLIEDELINSGKRYPLSGNYIKSKFGISEHLLSKLEDSSLLRKERDANGRILYEVSHDSLIGAINKIAEDRRRKEDEEKQAAFQLEFEKEKKRSTELALLNEKANKRLGLFRIALVFAVLAMLATIFFAIDSNRQKAKAEKALADKNMEESKGKAKDLMQRADEFMNAKGSNYKQYALQRYKQALVFLEPYKNRNDSLYTMILYNIEICEK